MQIRAFFKCRSRHARAPVLALTLIASPFAYAEERTWICTEQAAGGLTNENEAKSWFGTSFEDSKSEVVIRPLTINELDELDYRRDKEYLDFYGVFESGTGDITPCNIGFTFLERGEFWQTPRIFCGINSYTEYHFDRDTLRALRFEKAGYIDDTSTDTPAIIGYTCATMPTSKAIN